MHKCFQIVANLLEILQYTDVQGSSQKADNASI
jgi:hypothetical protein